MKERKKEKVSDASCDCDSDSDCGCDSDYGSCCDVSFVEVHGKNQSQNLNQMNLMLTMMNVKTKNCCHEKMTRMKNHFLKPNHSLTTKKMMRKLKKKEWKKTRRSCPSRRFAGRRRRQGRAWAWS